MFYRIDSYLYHIQPYLNKLKIKIRLILAPINVVQKEEIVGIYFLGILPLQLFLSSIKMKVLLAYNTNGILPFELTMLCNAPSVIMRNCVASSTLV